MSGFLQALPHVLKYEGGYVNDPDDPGGATNKGVTQNVYDAYRKSINQAVQSVKKISSAEVNAIYYTRYWVAGKCDALPWPMSLVHFDACVNTGTLQATKLLQRAAGAAADGVWGQKTAAAIAAEHKGHLLAEMLLERLRFYDLLVQQKPTLGKFFRGWVNRVLRLREAATP